MAEDIFLNGDGTVAFFPAVQAVVMETGTTSRPTVAKKATELSVSAARYKVAPWGDTNAKPQDVYDKIKKLPFGPRSHGNLARLLYGQGIRYGYVTGMDDTGKEILEYRYDEEISNFINKNNLNTRYLVEAAVDLKWWGNVFPEMIMSMDGQKILSVVTQEAPFCRWTSHNTKGYSDYCLVSANWPAPSEEEISAIPSFDVYSYDRVNEVKRRKLKRVMYPLSFPSPLKTYYQDPDWMSVMDSGWIELAINIPKLKEAIIKNQITIKYHIQIPADYWSWQHADWSKKTDEERAKIRKEFMEDFNKKLAGHEKAGNSIFTFFKSTPDGKEFGNWGIKLLQAEYADGAYNMDSQEAVAQYCYAAGIDPTIFGLTIGKGMGAGSGSDKRVAFNILDLLNNPDRELLIEPLHFIRDYNGWDPKLRFFIAGNSITTLDTGGETKQKTPGTNDDI